MVVRTGKWHTGGLPEIGLFELWATAYSLSMMNPELEKG
jgi:hypothetical protein